MEDVQNMDARIEAVAEAALLLINTMPAHGRGDFGAILVGIADIALIPRGYENALLVALAIELTEEENGREADKTGTD